MGLIPILGLEKGWPSQIDFNNLHVHVYALADHLWAVTQKYIPSDFRDIVVKYLANPWSPKSPEHLSQYELL
ncbi:hypothetical protein VP01_3330g2 [Puccinia sorghi]|uniref:Uncharacterized protein n=1 Tax=Puccinia sorghi TaxID=27349 RepID=A0A0L6UX57_9BASI|nr:hypothetical protein VP01_3330g2 [Puccinia sorghi]